MTTKSTCADYEHTQKATDEAYFPHEVVASMVDNDWSIIRAWREYLGLTQQQIAERMQISQPAYAQLESSKKVRKQTREKIAAALGVALGLLAV